ncbi:MAG: tRNA (adenosine(37)-N6)-threonylcarbamoyltransferase complex ATPase subunit type 1 TsaE [bacterium]
MKDIIISNSAEETLEFGEKLGKKLKKNTLIALYGEFGAGKTVFVKGIAKGLDCNIDVNSPSFVFMNEYQCKIPLYHIDLYRINKLEDVLSLGLDELFESQGVCVIEWAEKATKLLPAKRIDIKINILDDGNREIEIINR